MTYRWLIAAGLLMSALGSTLTYSSDHSVISLIFTWALWTATGAAWANLLSARRMRLQRRPQLVLRDLRPSAALSDSVRIYAGHHVCDMLHAGQTPEQIGSTPGPTDSRGVVAAAQHELCPDTLH